MTTGAIILPKSSPNLIQNEFNGDSNLELSSPKIKKIMEIMIKLIFGLLSFVSGHNPSPRKTTKNNIPKLLLEDFLFKTFPHIFNFF